MAIIDDHSRRDHPRPVEQSLKTWPGIWIAWNMSLVTNGDMRANCMWTNGPALRSRHIDHLTASLGVAVHPTAQTVTGQPGERIKIERCFRSVRNGCMSTLQGPYARRYSMPPSRYGSTVSIDPTTTRWAPPKHGLHA